jgi:hypothetical protein
MVTKKLILIFKSIYMSNEVSKQELITKISVDKGYSVDINGNVFNKDGKQLSIGKSKKGYLSFNIKIEKGGNATRSFVHRLQAYQKFGDKIFEQGVVVRHLNGISTDNSYDNIEIGTYSENSLDVPKEKRIKLSSKANLKYDHEAIINDKKNGLSFSEIMAKHGISSKGTISFILKKSLESTK